MYYFAYGSNLVWEHMRRICGRSCLPLGVVSLPDYELGVDKRGYINIRPHAGREVYGLLYELDEIGLKALDNFEGYPGIFNRIQVQVLKNDGDKVEAWLYLEPEDQFGGDYLREEFFHRVIFGAEQAGLPEEYIKHLKALKKYAHVKGIK